MALPTPPRMDTGVTMSDADFSAFSRLIHAETGIVMNEGKRSMLVSRLSRRLRAMGLDDFGAYRRLLETGAGEAERRELISAITTNVTSFFREPVHFEVLASMAPEMAARARHGERIRIWSAGCSSGEEPYSIAMTLAEAWPDASKADFRLLATDIDPEMVARARRGTYDAQQLGPNAPPALRRHAHHRTGEPTFAIDPALRATMRFEELNLLGPWPFQGMFDIIFCRNVVIYFDAETRLRLWRRFAERLRPGGTLFIGHSERVDADLEDFLQPAGVTQYRRTARPVTAAHAPSD
ncbi:protein-glutamate O-methyltransferase [Roseibacterium sp. SDUM158016]|uniref:CheR family methyltransferase n=1 Tax=Roseicyclus sediminis TaxID=2980997 RepID=UPI0021D241D3|nr:protein-glutamate O-methyltransferase [Roseibacterium sp. SDUM158016]MCU4651585.1 protein-glutamate O-methyltransferase [Roseibacterium sp. SDUM158016]